MKSNEIVNQMKSILNIPVNLEESKEVKLERMKLENGTVIEAESFEKGKEIFIITDDEKVAMPVGEYMLEGGKLLVVEKEGIIGDMRNVSDGVPQKEEAEETEDLSEEDSLEEDLAEEDEMGYEKKMAEVVELEKRIKSLEDAFANFKKEKMEASSDVNDLSSEIVKEELKEEVKEEVKKEVEKEVEEKLSNEPAAKAIRHSPEGENANEMKFVYSPNRIETTLDRILTKINNIK